MVTSVRRAKPSKKGDKREEVERRVGRKNALLGRKDMAAVRKGRNVCSVGLQGCETCGGWRSVMPLAVCGFKIARVGEWR